MIDDDARIDPHPTDAQLAELEAFSPDLRCEVCGDDRVLAYPDGGEEPCPFCPPPSRRCDA